MIPAVINVFYPGWFPLDLLCLHSSVLCKIPVTSIVPCEYVTQLPYCPLHKKSDARVVKLHSDSTQTLLRVCLSVIHPRFAHPRRETPFHADTGTQKVCGRYFPRLHFQCYPKGPPYPPPQSPTHPLPLFGPGVPLYWGI